MGYKENKLRFEKHVHKLRYLRAELDECDHIFDVCKKKFSEEFTKSVDKLNKKDKKSMSKIDDNMGRQKKTREQKKEDDKPRAIKTLYRKIALKTHPDKENRKKRNSLFRAAEKAYSKNNWFELIEIASSIGIRLPIPTKKQIKWLKNEEENLYKKIGIIRKSVSWNWYHTEEEELKNKIMENYVISILGER